MSKLIVLLVAVAAVWGLPRGGPKKAAQIRILGGQDADIDNHPHQLQLRMNDISSGNTIAFCGAVMISSKWVLTAAHCTDPYLNADGTLKVVFLVGAGADNLYKGGEYIHVANVYQNPQYDNNTYDYDISVLELIHHITTPTARPIPLHDSGYVAEEGVLATATGWGCKKVGELGVNILQVVVGKVVSNDICNDLYHGVPDLSREITERMACAGNMATGDQNFCRGDSGGPLVVHGKLYGISSWGKISPEIYDTYLAPSVFCRISEQSIREFIRNKTGI